MRGGSDVIQLTLALKMTTTQVVEMSFTVSNSPIQDYTLMRTVSTLFDCNPNSGGGGVLRSISDGDDRQIFWV